MRKALLITLLLGSAQFSAAKTECYGIALSEDGEVCASILGGGIAQLNTRDRTLLVGRDGKLITAPTRTIWSFNDGLAAAQEPAKIERWGFLNAQGSWQIAPQWHAVMEFADGHALVQAKPDAPWQVIDRSGQIKTTLPADMTPESPFWGGLAMVTIPTSQMLWSPDQTITLPAGIKAKDAPHEGLIVASHGNVRKYGYLKPDGQWHIPPVYDFAFSFMSGFAAVNLGEQWQIIDRNGKTVRNFPGKRVWGDHQAQLWHIEMADGSRMQLKADGSALDASPAKPAVSASAPALPAELSADYDIHPMMGNAAGLPRALLYPKKDSDKPAGLILADGTIFWPKDALGFGTDGHRQAEMPFVLETKSGWGAIDAKGNWVIPPRFKYLSEFSAGMASLKQYETEGVAYADGKIALPTDGSKWSDISSSGIAIFEKDYAKGVVDIRSGKVLLPASEGYLSRPVGMVIIRSSENSRMEGLWHLGEARWLLQPECDDLKILAAAYWLCAPERRSIKKAFLISLNGERIPLDSLQEETGSYTFTSQGKRGVLTSQGLFWPPQDGNYTPLNVDPQQKPWLLNSGGQRYAWIDPQGKEVFSYSAEKIYRDKDTADLAVGITNGKTVVFNIRQQMQSPQPLQAGERVVHTVSKPGMTITYTAAQDMRKQTSVALGERTLVRSGTWLWVAKDTLTQSYYSAPDEEKSLWLVKENRLVPTPYTHIDTAGANDWLRIWDGEQHKYRFLDTALKPVLPTGYDNATVFDGGLAWVLDGTQLKLLNDKGQTVGQVPTACPSNWTIGNAKPVTCQKK